MDYGNIVSRAWEITKRYRMLWLLGLFAGGSSMFSSGGSSSGTRWSESASTTGDMARQWSMFVEWFYKYESLIIFAGLVLMLVSVVFWALGIAARGGLVREIEFADAGHVPSLRRGWGFGFSKFWRTFGVSIVTALPMLIFVGIFIAAIVAMGLPFVLALAHGDSPQLATGTGFALLGVFIIGFPIMIVLGYISAAWARLSLCAAMLEDLTLGVALKRGWQIIRTRFGYVFAVGLIEFGLSIVIAIAIGIVTAILAMPAVVFGVIGARDGFGNAAMPAIAAVLGGLVFVVFLMLTGMFNTFFTAIWVTFFRTVTGRHVLPVVPAAPAPATWSPKSV